MKVVIYTRLVYSKEGPVWERIPDPWVSGGILTPERMDLIQRHFIGSLSRQVDKDFEVRVKIGKLRAPIIDGLDWRGLKVSFMDSFKNDTIPEIQARLDTDDLVAPGWTAHMRLTADRLAHLSDFIIHYRPFIQDNDGTLSYSPLYHSNERTSGFLAWVQRNEPRQHLMGFDHSHIAEKSGGTKVVQVPEGYVSVGIHGEEHVACHRTSRHMKLGLPWA
jgi:hypothetical protein